MVFISIYRLSTQPTQSAPRPPPHPNIPTHPREKKSCFAIGSTSIIQNRFNVFLLTVDFHTCSVSFSHYSANGRECKLIKTLLSQLTFHLVFIHVYVYIKCLTTKKCSGLMTFFRILRKKCSEIKL